MGRASSRKRARRERKPLFIDLESHVVNDKAWMGEWASTEARQMEHLRRQYGKAATLSLMYGSGTSSMQLPKKKHPLEYDTSYKLVELADKRFGHVPVYKVVTKQISSIIDKRGATLVPETRVWCRPVDELWSAARSDVIAIAWIRKHRIDELQQAVAYLLMLDKEPVILRAFEP